MEIRALCDILGLLRSLNGLGLQRCAQFAVPDGIVKFSHAPFPHSVNKERRMPYGLFTTGDIAERLNLAMRTVADLVDSGDLKGHYVPGGRRKYRRVTRADLIAFCRKEGRDDVADDLEAEAARHILVATRDEALSATVASLRKNKSVFVTHAPTTYDLGAFAAEHKRIDVLVADAASFPSLNDIRRRLAAARRDPLQAFAVMRDSQERLLTRWERFSGAYDPELLCARIESKLAELVPV